MVERTIIDYHGEAVEYSFSWYQPFISGTRLQPPDDEQLVDFTLWVDGQLIEDPDFTNEVHDYVLNRIKRDYE